MTRLFWSAGGLVTGLLLATMFLQPGNKCAGPIATMPIPAGKVLLPAPQPQPKDTLPSPSNRKCEPDAAWYENLAKEKRAPRIDSVPAH